MVKRHTREWQSTYEWHKHDIRVHADNIRAHTSDIRVHTGDIQMTCEWYASTND